LRNDERFTAEKVKRMASNARDWPYEYDGPPIDVPFKKKDIEAFVNRTFREAGTNIVDEVWVPHGLRTLLSVCEYRNIHLDFKKDRRRD